MLAQSFSKVSAKLAESFTVAHAQTLLSGELGSVLSFDDKSRLLMLHSEHRKGLFQLALAVSRQFQQQEAVRQMRSIADAVAGAQYLDNGRTLSCDPFVADIRYKLQVVQRATTKQGNTTVHLPLMNGIFVVGDVSYRDLLKLEDSDIQKAIKLNVQKAVNSAIAAFRPMPLQNRHLFQNLSDFLASDLIKYNYSLVLGWMNEGKLVRADRAFLEAENATLYAENATLYVVAEQVRGIVAEDKALILAQPEPIELNMSAVDRAEMDAISDTTQTEVEEMFSELSDAE